MCLLLHAHTHTRTHVSHRCTHTIASTTIVFGSNMEEGEDFDDVLLWCSQVVEVAERPAAAIVPGPGPLAPARDPRGRKRGFRPLQDPILDKVQAQFEEHRLAVVVGTSLRSKRRDAALRSWESRRQSQAGVPNELQLVPFNASNVLDIQHLPMHALIAPNVEDHSLLNNFLSLTDLSSCTGDTNTEERIWFAFTSRISKHHLAHLLSCCSKTLTRSTRGLAYCTILYKRVFAVRVIATLNAKLPQFLGVSVEPLLWITKFKYDEMSLHLRSRSGSSRGDVTIIKMLQTNCWWHMVWLVDNTFPLRCVIKVPTSLVPIEKNNRVCLFHGLLPQIQAPAIAQAFPAKLLMTTADDHAANSAAENSLWEATYEAKETEADLERYRCMAHKEFKIGEFLQRPFYSDVRGVLHTCLSFNLCGTLQNFKSNFKRYIRLPGVFKFKMVLVGHDAAGPEAAAHRDCVFATFCREHTQKNKLSGNQRRRNLIFHPRKRLLNGNYKRHGIIEHWCRGCCLSREDALKQFDEHIIEPLTAPQVFKTSTWNEIEEPLDDVGFWISCHNIWTPVFSMTFDKTESNPDAPALEEPLAEDAGPAEDRDEQYGPQVHLDMPDPEKGVPIHERAKTYRLNALRWLASRPLARLFGLRRIVQEQQTMMNVWFKHAGSSWEISELKRRCGGELPRYRVLMWHNGYYSESFMKRYRSMGDTSDAWIGIPAEFRTHDFANMTYRSCAAATAATEQLKNAPSKSYPAKGYALLDGVGDDEVDVVAADIVRDFICKPCTMNSVWYGHVKQHNSVDALRSPASRAKVEARADAAEIENIVTETQNASIRRDAYRHTQAKTVDIEDVNAHWVLRQEKQETDSVFREPKQPPEVFTAAATNENVGQAHGEGGRCRAFVSHFSRLAEFRRDDGQVLFSKIMARYKVEMQTPDSDFMREMAARGQAGKRAAKASRARAHVSGCTQTTQQSKLSAFGVVKPRILERGQNDRQAKELYVQWKAASGPVHDDAILAVGMKSFSDFVDQRSGPASQLHDHKSTISRVCKVASKEDALKHQRSTDALRELLLKPAIFLNKQLQDIGFPDHVQLRTVPVGHGIELRPQFDCDGFTSKGYARARKRKGGALLFSKLWSDNARLKLESEMPHLPAVHKSFLPTVCFQYGYGTCLCSGRGLVLNLARKALARTICSLGGSDKQSDARRFLTAGWLLVRLSCLPLTLLHVAICYLRPRRPTFIKGVTHPELFHGYHCFKPSVSDDRWEAIIDIALLKTLNLDDASTMEVFKFVVLDQSMGCMEMDGGWTPSGRLTYERYFGLRDPTEPLVWWQGAQKELELEAEKSRKAAAAQQRKEQKRKGSGRAPIDAPKKKAARRDSQKPSVEDVLALEDEQPEAHADEDDCDDGVDEEMGKEHGDNSDVDEVVALQATNEAEQCSDSDVDNDEMHVASLFMDSDESDGDDVRLDGDVVVDVPSPDDERQVASLFMNSDAGDGDNVPPDGDVVVDEPPPDDGGDVLPPDDGDVPADVPPVPPGDMLVAAPAAPAAAAAPAGHVGPRLGKWLEDRSGDADIPADCTLRRYAPKRGAHHEYWEAKLPKGQVDSSGRHSHSRSIKGGTRTNDEACAECLLWLLASG